jgi:transcriptional regulator with XRE-family HTH domain
MKYEELRRIVSQRTKKLRDTKGWNQRQLEQHSGVNQKTISNLEATEASVQLDTLAAVAEALGLEAWEMLRPEINDQKGIYEVDPRAAIKRDGLPGLRELVADDGATATLKITPEEWRRLAAVGAVLPPTVDKAGFVQLLFTLRTIAR